MTLTHTLKDFAEITGVSLRTVYRKVDAGEIPVIRIGRRVFVPRAYLDRLFADAGCPREAANV